MAETIVRSCRCLLIAALLTAGFAASSTAEEAGAHADSVNFTSDVLPVLSKYGCNSGQCHGKAIGQNGFKLSLYGFDPESDYAALVHESRGRRVSLAAPEDSLTLLKATATVAHGGGARFEVGSEPYRLMKQWFAAGAPWGNESDPKLVAIEVEPAEVLAVGKQQHPLKVTARYSDDSRRDVTTLARYDSETPMLLEVDARGVVTTTGATGDGLVMVRYGDMVGTSRILLPHGPPLADEAYSNFEVKNLIDELALRKWKKLGIAPSPPASDSQFLRRIYLDTLGMLPTPDEVREFLADESPDKRQRLAEQLLDRDEHADLWALKWGELLRIKLGDSSYKQNTIEFRDWIRNSIKSNKPYDQFVREILTASGKRSDHPQIDWWRIAINNQVRVEDTSQVFLGLRVSCANCHNHPFENISQNDYWHFAAFFARVDSPSYGEVKEIKLDEKGKVKHPRTGEEMQPQAFGGELLPFVDGQDPRVQLVDWMTSPDNPYFARAIANRVWGHYLKVGLVDPVDDMRATNPASNPELLDALARELIEHNYDLKHLTRMILTSGVYGLSCDPILENQADRRNFARHYPQRLWPHVLNDAIASATGAAVKFDDYPEVKRAVLLPNEKGRSDFLDVFGRSSRDTPCECGTRLELNLGQVLYLLHSDDLQRKLSAKEGTVAQLIEAQKPLPESIEEIYLRTFSRLPTEEELQAAVGFASECEKPQEALEDLLWTLMNSNEFIFNH